MKISKVNIGVDRSFGNQPVKFPVNTTADFGFCQPVFSHLLAPTESLKVHAKQLVRNAVMPCPTFCDIKSVNKAVFVPFSDLYPGFDALLAQQPINGDIRYVPSRVPCITNQLLRKLLLKPEFSYCTYYNARRNSESILGNVYDTEVVRIGAGSSWQSLFSHYYSDVASWSFSPQENNSGITLGMDDITFNNADFVFTHPDNIVSSGSSFIAPAFCCVRLNRRGSHLAKVLYGLGYSLEITDTDNLHILPLLAYYKAWFDSYSPLRFMNWHGTNAYALIRYLYNSGVYNISGDSTALELFEKFINDLSECYYTDKDDFMSVHTSKLYPAVNHGDLDVSSSTTIDLDNAGTLASAQRSIYVSTDRINPNSGGGTLQNSINEITLRTLYKLTKYIAKDSVIGRNVQAWVRAHYGSETCEDMFRQVYDLGTFVVDCKVDEIFSTSDTVNGDKGEHLGSYGGKGLGFGTGNINFKADTFGYVIVMQSIVSNSDYFQGNDTTLYCRDRYTFPSREFDALGYEVTSKAAVLDCLGFDDGVSNFVQRGFGFVPRFTGLKVHKALLNGNMRFRGDFDAYSPYHTCRIIRPFETEYDGSHLTINVNSIPDASVAWRFNGRYPQTSDYNRIFAFDDQPQGLVRTQYDRLDNFIVQMVWEGNHKSITKSIADSYDTFDSEDTSKSSVSVE